MKIGEGPQGALVIHRDRFLDAARRLAAEGRNGVADPEDMATELGIGLYEVTQLVRQYRNSFHLASVPVGKLRALSRLPIAKNEETPVGKPGFRKRTMGWGDTRLRSSYTTNATA
jgi:hypothetical protein